jgi:hypothetical protein
MTEFNMDSITQGFIHAFRLISTSILICRDYCAVAQGIRPCLAGSYPSGEFL